MNSILVCILISACICSYTEGSLNDKPYVIINADSDLLTFDDYAASGVTKKMINSFTKIVNQASTYYKDDIAANLKHIKENMDFQFGSAIENFLIILQTKSTKSSYFVWITDDKVYASFSSGVNNINPKWSYLFVRINVIHSSENNIFIQTGQKGSGITANIQATMERAIDLFEKTSGSSCPCSQDAMYNIGYYLNDRLNLEWSSLCGNPGLTHALVYAAKGLWINKQRGSCEYTFYVHEI